jgi:hypothetical protein
MSGKCDSLHSSSKTALTKLIGNPVLWNGEPDNRNLIGNNTTQELDSLKVLNNTFWSRHLRNRIQSGKGQNLYGSLKIHEVDIIKMQKFSTS